jgi:3-amino-5-hydroxybenzoic acid synthesis related protein
MVFVEVSRSDGQPAGIESAPQRRQIDHVIFDLDGTIVDNSRTMKRAFDEAFRASGGIGDAPFADLISRQGQPFPVILSELGLSLDMEPIFSRLSQRYVDMTRPADGIDELLEGLKGAGVKLSIASGKSRSRARWVLDHFGLLSHFDRVVGSDDVTNGKPAPDMILRCIDEARCDPAETLMIGDAQADYLAARAAGIRFGLAGWFPHAQIADDQIFFVRSPLEVRDLVLGPPAVSLRSDCR